jgi:transcriptional regulator with XRE-family HTH domain
VALVQTTFPIYPSDMVTTRQMRAARALLGWSQQDISDRTGLGVNTINDIERGARDPRKSTWDKIVLAFSDAGIEFIGDGQASLTGGEGVRMKERG